MKVVKELVTVHEKLHHQLRKLSEVSYLSKIKGTHTIIIFHDFYLSFCNRCISHKILWRKIKFHPFAEKLLNTLKITFGNIFQAFHNKEFKHQVEES